MELLSQRMLSMLRPLLLRLVTAVVFLFSEFPL